jgi:hypothetical protein
MMRTVLAMAWFEKEWVRVPVWVLMMMEVARIISSVTKFGSSHKYTMIYLR